jgi:hypothetical protein
MVDEMRYLDHLVLIDKRNRFQPHVAMPNRLSRQFESWLVSRRNRAM